jgi:hypothetical protein
MALIVVPAPKCMMVDTDVKLTPPLLNGLSGLGYEGIIRYVPLPGVDPRNDIDPEELERILAHPKGFFSCFVQHPRYDGWKPREHSPELDARCAVRFARAAGYPSGVHGFVDAEGMNADTTWQEAHSYNSRWAHIMVEEGFRAGLYDGYSQPETPDELYLIHDVSSYWSDLANRKVAVRGTAIVQRTQFELLGAPFDPDLVGPDLLGDTPFMVQTAAVA